MGVRRIEDLIAFQLAREFKLEVYRLVRAHPGASQDFRFKGQLFDAASGVESCVREGFRRFQPAEFSQFLRYALASLQEAEGWLGDGVDREYFTVAATAPALLLAKRCSKAMLGLRQAQERFRRERTAGSPGTPGAIGPTGSTGPAGSRIAGSTAGAAPPRLPPRRAPD